MRGGKEGEAYLEVYQARSIEIAAELAAFCLCHRFLGVLHLRLYQHLTTRVEHSIPPVLAEMAWYLKLWTFLYQITWNVGIGLSHIILSQLYPSHSLKNGILWCNVDKKCNWKSPTVGNPCLTFALSMNLKYLHYLTRNSTISWFRLSLCKC